MTSQNGSRSVGAQDAFLYAVAALCVALNVGLGVVVNAIKLPIYLDAIGTIAFALLAGRLGLKGFFLAAAVGAASFAITGLLFNPVVFWFIPTQIVIAAFSFYVIRPVLAGLVEGGAVTFSRTLTALAMGASLGLIAGVVSAPIIAYVFGGITGSGPSLIVALLLRSGASLMESVMTAGISTELLDKTLQLIFALALARATPSRVRASLDSPR
jgi:energy-coupling factor transport system substrate-specific component